MLNANDLEQLKAKGISEKQIEEQLACFVKGFPFLEIAASASVEKVRGEYRERYSSVGSLGRVQGGGIQFIGAERLELRAATERLVAFP